MYPCTKTDTQLTPTTKAKGTTTKQLTKMGTSETIKADKKGPEICHPTTGQQTTQPQHSNKQLQNTQQRHAQQARLPQDAPTGEQPHEHAFLEVGPDGTTVR